MKMKNLLICTLLGAFVAGCSSNASKTTTSSGATTGLVSKEANAAVKLDRNVVVTVDFIQGGNQLTADAEKRIEKAIVDARKMGNVKHVEVAAWADVQYPAKGQKLSKDQVKLASERAKNVEKFVERVERSADVSTYNMAKQPNRFQKWINTRDAEVKNQLADAGIVSRDSSITITERKSVAMVFIETQ